jgi:hypothetical protein
VGSDRADKTNRPSLPFRVFRPFRGKKSSPKLVISGSELLLFANRFARFIRFSQVADPFPSFCLDRSRALLTGKQCPNLRNQFGGDGHECYVVGVARRLDVGELLILGLVFVVNDHLLYAILIPAGGKLLLTDFGFLRCLRRKAFLALPRGSYAVITNKVSGSNGIRPNLENAQSGH